MSDLASAPPARLVTAFGTVLYVDAASGELRHGPFGSSPVNAVFVADPGSRSRPAGLAACTTRTVQREPIVCLADRSIRVSRSQQRRRIGRADRARIDPAGTRSDRVQGR